MNRRISIVLVLVLVIACVFAFTACGDDTDYRNPNAASTVREVAYEAIEGNIVRNITSFKDFKKSEFNIKSSFGDEYSKIFYNKQYFDEKNLIAVKFNDVKGSSFYISNVEQSGNNINVNILRNLIGDKTDKTTYCLYLEVAKGVSADKVTLNINPFDGENVMTPLYSKAPEGAKTLDARILSDKESLASYVDAGNNVIMSTQLKIYDDEFFKDKKVVVAKVLLRPSARVYMSTDGSVVTLNSYASDHYVNSDRDKTDSSYRAIFIPIAKDASISEVVLNTHLEADLGTAEVFKSQKAQLGA